MDENTKAKLWVAFRALGEHAITLSHYDLEKETPFVAGLWKRFLKEADVAEYIQNELELMQEAELKKILYNISGEKSVGKAQVLTALQKMKEQTHIKSGPVFIYSHVPLTERQEKQKD